MFGQRRKPAPFDRGQVASMIAQRADHEAGNVYLSPQDSYRQLSSFRDVLALQAAAALQSDVERLDATWRRSRKDQDLRELTVLYPAHALVARIRDAAGQAPSPEQTAAARAALRAAVAHGEHRLAQCSGNGPDAVLEFFGHPGGTAAYLDRLVEETLTAYLEPLAAAAESRD